MRLFFAFLFLLAVYSCSEPAKTESNGQSAAAKKLYERNLASLKKGIAAIENENIADWASTISDTTIWNGAAYGSTPGTKEDWKKSLINYFADWDSIKLNYPDFLPGIDSATHEFDGSVRYYGIWNAIHKSGIRTSVNMYATYDFNKEGLIVNSSEFFDVGGLNDVIQKGKPGN